MKKIDIIGMGYSVPNNPISNVDLANFVETSDEWIKSRTGIENRYIATTETTSTLATQAALKAIADANINATDIDGIIVATFTPDSSMPSMASLVQAHLQLNDQVIMAFDINAACSGFVIATQVASALLETNQCRTVLVIGAETISKVLDWEDRTTCVLFGDGAGAVLYQANLSKDNSDQEFSMVHYANSQGDTEGVLITEKKANGYLKMQGQPVFRFAVAAIMDAIDKVCTKANISIDQIDFLIPHQANLRIIQHISEKLKIPQEKMIINVQEFGNTSAASIPMAMAQAKQNQRLKKGDLILMVGFGGGLTWAATLMKC